jgi:hypothetical protein
MCFLLFQSLEPLQDKNDSPFPNKEPWPKNLNYFLKAYNELQIKKKKIKPGLCFQYLTVCGT